jgi:hypothetical protein
MKLIFLSSLPISRIFGEKIDAWWYRDQGLDVEFWDSSLLFLGTERVEAFFASAKNYRYVGPNHHIFTEWAELEDALDDLVSGPHLVWHMSRFDRMHNDDALLVSLNRHDATYIFQHFDPHKRTVGWLNTVKAPSRELRQLWYARDCKPAAVVTSGVLGRRQARLRYPSTNVISVPSIKVLWEPRSVSVTSSCAIFVDENLVYDPDAQLHGQVLCSDVPSYYRRMRDLFSRVEDQLGVPVVVACSGKYQYDDTSEYFGERTVVYEQTLPLLQNCELALGHFSLALDQAIVSRKPVLLVDDPDFTEWRRRGFRDVNSRFRLRPVLNERIGAAEISGALRRDIGFYSEVEKRYFREPGIDGDFKHICLAAFLTLAEKRSMERTLRNDMSENQG